MKGYIKESIIVGVVGLLAITFAGCVSDRQIGALNQAISATYAPFSSIAMLTSGGCDLLYCSASFRRKNERWPADYPELSDFVRQSDGYLTLGNYKRVELAQLPDDRFQITFVREGFTNEVKLTLESPPRDTLVTPQARPTQPVIKSGDQVLNVTLEALAQAKTDQQRFYFLNRAAKLSFAAGNTEDARNYATELLALMPKFRNDWNYGNAVQDGNLVLGRIAVKEGRMQEAKGFLLAAGKSPGSPQMNSFGPNMSLAEDLLKKGERDVVLEYFELCRKFWKLDRGRLDEWSQEVKAGQIPIFGADLVY